MSRKTEKYYLNFFLILLKFFTYKCTLSENSLQNTTYFNSPFPDLPDSIHSKAKIKHLVKNKENYSNEVRPLIDSKVETNHIGKYNTHNLIEGTDKSIERPFLTVKNVRCCKDSSFTIINLVKDDSQPPEELAQSKNSVNDNNSTHDSFISNKINPNVCTIERIVHYDPIRFGLEIHPSRKYPEFTTSKDGSKTLTYIQTYIVFLKFQPRVVILFYVYIDKMENIWYGNDSIERTTLNKEYSLYQPVLNPISCSFCCKYPNNISSQKKTDLQSKADNIPVITRSIRNESIIEAASDSLASCKKRDLKDEILESLKKDDCPGKDYGLPINQQILNPSVCYEVEKTSSKNVLLKNKDAFDSACYVENSEIPKIEIALDNKKSQITSYSHLKADECSNKIVKEEAICMKYEKNEIGSFDDNTLRISPSTESEDAIKHTINKSLFQKKEVSKSGVISKKPLNTKSDIWKKKYKKSSLAIIAKKETLSLSSESHNCSVDFLVNPRCLTCKAIIDEYKHQEESKNFICSFGTNAKRKNKTKYTKINILKSPQFSQNFQINYVFDSKFSELLQTEEHETTDHQNFVYNKNQNSCHYKNNEALELKKRDFLEKNGCFLSDSIYQDANNKNIMNNSPVKGTLASVGHDEVKIQVNQEYDSKKDTSVTLKTNNQGQKNEKWILVSGKKSKSIALENPSNNSFAQKSVIKKQQIQMKDKKPQETQANIIQSDRVNDFDTQDNLKEEEQWFCVKDRKQKAKHTPIVYNEHKLKNKIDLLRNKVQIKEEKDQKKTQKKGFEILQVRNKKENITPTIHAEKSSKNQQTAEVTAFENPSSMTVQDNKPQYITSPITFTDEFPDKNTIITSLGTFPNSYLLTAHRNISLDNGKQLNLLDGPQKVTPDAINNENSAKVTNPVRVQEKKNSNKKHLQDEKSQNATPFITQNIISRIKNRKYTKINFTQDKAMNSFKTQDNEFKGINPWQNRADLRVEAQKKKIQNKITAENKFDENDTMFEFCSLNSKMSRDKLKKCVDIHNKNDKNLNINTKAVDFSNDFMNLGLEFSQVDYIHKKTCKNTLDIRLNSELEKKPQGIKFNEVSIKTHERLGDHTLKKLKVNEHDLTTSNGKDAVLIEAGKIDMCDKQTKDLVKELEDRSEILLKKLFSIDKDIKFLFSRISNESSNRYEESFPMHFLILDQITNEYNLYRISEVHLKYIFYVLSVRTKLLKVYLLKVSEFKLKGNIEDLNKLYDEYTFYKKQILGAIFAVKDLLVKSRSDKLKNQEISKYEWKSEVLFVYKSQCEDRMKVFTHKYFEKLIFAKNEIYKCSGFFFEFIFFKANSDSHEVNFENKDRIIYRNDHEKLFKKLEKSPSLESFYHNFYDF